MLSLVLPARNWPGDRLEACIRSFLRLKSRTLSEIVVVDFGSDEPISVGVRDKRLRVVRVEANRWSLAEAINVGVVASVNAIVAKTDGDIVVARESGPALDAAVAAIADGSMAVGVVQATDLPQGIDAAAVLKAETDTLVREGRLRARWGQGGLCLFSTDAWNAVGGFESRFHGWGNEDNDFVDRVRRASGRMRWIAGVRIFHVWHPPSYVAKHIFQAREANRRLYLDDKSTLRSVRFLHARPKSLPAPNVANAPRPLVTIAIASKARPGRERMLLEAVRGFHKQINGDFEVVIADNGSTPEESRILRTALARLPRSVRVRVLDLAQASIPAARNRISDEAAGRYICVADDDDIPLATRLADHLGCFRREAGIHGSHGGWIDFDELTGVVEQNTGGERNLANFLFGPGRPSAHPASLFRTDVMRAIRYDESIRYGSDFDLAARMANMGMRVEHTGTYVVLRRFHQANVTIDGLSDQLAVASTARSRIIETLGPSAETRLREAVKSTRISIPCENTPSRERLLSLLPGYCGIWRLLVPMAALGGASLVRAERPRAILVAGANGRAPAQEEQSRPALNGHDSGRPLTEASIGVDGGQDQAALMARAEALTRLMDGDIGFVDAGVDPALFYVSKPIRGAARALGTKAAIEDQLDVDVELIPDVEFERRHTTPFDWSKMPREGRHAMLVSRPIKSLDQALSAMASLPASTALRAMTSIVSDFNCTDRLYRLVTTPLLTEGGPARAKKFLERQTGQKFETIADAGLPQ